MDRERRRHAIQACGYAIQRKTDQAFPGPYGSANFDRRPDVERIGRGTIQVKAPVQIRGRFASETVPARCTLRFGRVADLDFNPYRARERMFQRRSSGWWFRGWGFGHH